MRKAATFLLFLAVSIYASEEKDGGELIVNIDDKPTDEQYGRLLTASNLQDGEMQLQRMLEDRPKMAQHIAKGDALWNWAVRQFAGDFRQIVWSSQPPDRLECESECSSDDVPAISVRATWTHGAKNSEKKSFSELWACAIFEIFNARNNKRFQELRREAVAGKLSRDEYVRGFLAAERSTAILQHDFFEQFWKPYCRLNGILACDLDESRWWHREPMPVDEFVSYVKKQLPAIYARYARAFDALTGQRIDSKK